MKDSRISDEYRHLADLFKSRRNALNLTFKEVGNMAGVDWQAVRRFEIYELKKIQTFIKSVAPVLGINLTKEMIPKPIPNKLNGGKSSKFGIRVFNLRTKLGLSQLEFARYFGISPTIISLIESGKYENRKKSEVFKKFKRSFSKVLKKYPELAASI